jgi:hypothetical protein
MGSGAKSFMRRGFLIYEDMHKYFHHIYEEATELEFFTMGAENRVGIGLSYRPARLHRLAEFIPWNRFLGSLKV